MAIGDLPKKSGALAGGLAAWASRLSFFTLAVLLALGGHLAFAMLLNALAAFGVDVAALDEGRRIVPALQILLFAVQTALVVFAIARSGIAPTQTYVGVAALLWAAGMLMITFVSAQCDLFGACL